MNDTRRYEWEIEDNEFEDDEIAYPRQADDPERLLLRIALRIANRREEEKEDERKNQNSIVWRNNT